MSVSACFMLCWLNFQIHLYVQPLEHMAAIHLGIGLIITILNCVEQEKSF